MKYPIILEHGETSWGASVPDLPGCVAVGDTRAEVMQLIREAVIFHIEGMKKDGDAIPQPSEVEMVEVAP